MTKAARPWGVRPHLFDICWVRFPYHGDKGRPARDMHPCLTIALGQDSERFWVGVVYGTSNLRLGQRDQIDAIVMAHTDLAAMGLGRATRFDFDRVMWLPWDDEYFVESKGNPGSPVHSRATDSLIHEVKETLRVRQAMGLPAYPLDPIPTVPEGMAGPVTPQEQDN